MNPILADTTPDSTAAAITGFLFLFIAVAGYFLPVIVAGANKHHNQTAIAVLNLFLGWTLIGWVAALAWACTKSPSQQVNRPTGTPANSAGADASPEDVMDMLERLGKLKEQGVLTESEFQAQKLELFNKGTPSVRTSVALQPTPPSTGRTTTDRLANFSVESPEPKDSSERLSGLAGAPQNQEVQEVAPAPATGLRALKLAAIALVSVAPVAIWIVVSLFSKPQPKALEKAVSVSTPDSTPHLTDDEIRKQNDIALAATPSKASPIAKDDLENPNHKFPDFSKKAKDLDKLDAQRTWEGIDQGSLASIDSLYEWRCRSYIESRLKDPGSAQYKFGSPRAAMLNKHILCWMVPAWINSKNSYGGYTGQEEFDFFVQGGANGDVITCFKPSLYTDKHGKIRVNNQQF
jgi:hypothetical protein